MSRSAVILRNVASNWVGFFISACVTLALTPFVLGELGTTRYGVWILTSSIIGYYGLLNLGFRAGVTQYLTRYLAAGDDHKASETMSSAVAVLASLGVVMAGLSVGAAYVAPKVFRLPEGMEREAFWCILIVGCSSAIQFGLSAFTSVFTAKQRFDLANVIGIVTRLLTAGGIVFALRMGYGLIGVSAATCAVSAIDYLVRWRVARRLAPTLEVSWRFASLARVREIGAFGLWNSLISINQFVYQHMPNFLIGTLMPIAAVGYYALATGLSRQINSVLSPVPQVVYPAAADLHVRGDRANLERLYHDGSRLTMLVMIPLVLVAAWASNFYRLWLGQKHLSEVSFHSLAFLFQILLISTGDELLGQHCAADARRRRSRPARRDGTCQCLCDKPVAQRDSYSDLRPGRRRVRDCLRVLYRGSHWHAAAGAEIPRFLGQIVLAQRLYPAAAGGSVTSDSHDGRAAHQGRGQLVGPGHARAVRRRWCWRGATRGWCDDRGTHEAPGATGVSPVGKNRSACGGPRRRQDW